MKRKMFAIIIGIIGIIVLVLVGWYVMFVHFGRGPAFPFLPVKEIELEVQQGEIIAEQPLMAMVETEEDARRVAEQYGIEFVSFSDGVAVYQTEEDPRQVITRGQEQGYTQLYLNFVRTTMGTTD